MSNATQRPSVPNEVAGRTNPGQSEATRQTRLAWIGCILAVVFLVSLGLGLYLPALSSNSVMDDASVFSENAGVCSGADWISAPFYADMYRPIWRPLATLSLRWNWAAWPDGRKEAVQVNLLLFLLSGLLSFGLFRRVGLGVMTSAGAAAILLAHPAVAESVLRLAGRSELLALAFTLAAFMLHVGWARRESACFGAARLGCAPLWAVLFFLALLSKESALVLPLLAIGTEMVYSQRGTGKERWRRRMLLLVVSAVVVSCWGGYRAGVMRGWPAQLRHNPAPDCVATLSRSERWALALSLPTHYGGIAVCAKEILPDYSHLLARPEDAPPIELGNPRTFGVKLPSAGRMAGGIGIILAPFLLFLLCRRRNPRVALGVWWVGITLLASLPILGTNGHVASARHLLFILPGLLMAAAVPVDFLTRGATAQGARILRATFVGFILLALLWSCSTKTRALARVWDNQDSLMNYLGAAAPLSPEAALYKGLMSVGRGDLDHGAAKLAESVGLFPRNARALLNLGLIWAQQGKCSPAMRAVRDAATVAGQTMPGSIVESQTHMILGVFYGEQNLDEEALLEFWKAIEIDSTNVDALARAGAMEALNLDMARDGIHHIRRALELDRSRGRLGALADRIRRVADEAEKNLELFGESKRDYGRAMKPHGDSAQPFE
ncbi:MAG: hypothetical protein KAY24_13410 [Candidatus Eisenbacteria sp.]|nr:hypothetical protein [Candidatus Eisenbacteria bacterium]